MENEPCTPPEWLLPAFLRSMRTLGAQDDAAIIATGEALIARWCDSARRFHTLKHLTAVLARLDELAESSHHPEALRIAAWYHGAVFIRPQLGEDPATFGEDFAASAALARTQLTRVGMHARMVEHIADLVERMREGAAADVDCAALIDADRAIFRAAPQRYKDHRMLIAEEYAGVPPLYFVVWRLAQVERYLAQVHIYSTSVAREWEDAARQNLESECAILKAQLAELDPTGQLACCVPLPASTPVPVGAACPRSAITRALDLTLPAASYELFDPRRPNFPAQAALSPPPPAHAPRRGHDSLTSTMESCFEDLDAFLAQPRPVRAVERPSRDPDSVPLSNPRPEWSDADDMGASIAEQIAAARLGRREMVRSQREIVDSESRQTRTQPPGG